MPLRPLQSLFVVFALAAFASCNRGPSAVRPPSLDASAAGSKAMELYDKNGDDKVVAPILEKLGYKLNRAKTNLGLGRAVMNKDQSAGGARAPALGSEMAK